MTTTHDNHTETTKLTRRYADVPSPLALTPDAYRRTAQMASEIAATYYETRGWRPVYTPPPQEELQSLRTLRLPEQGISAVDILAFFAESIMPYDMGNQVETFSAWVNPAAAPISSLLDYLASVMNPTAAKGLHAATEVEKLVIRWLDELIGFPMEEEGSGGIFVNGGSLANFHGLAAALHWSGTHYDWDTVQQGVQGKHPRFVLYGSREVHSCISKAVRMLGLGLHAYRRIATDESYRLDLHALEAAIEADREAGLWPFAVVASAGTVNTGAVDPLSAVADLCEQQGLWFHIDSAFGWPGFLDPHLAPLYGDGMARADSIALDGHKWLAASNTCSCTLVRRKEMLEGAFGFAAAYLELDEDEQSFGAGTRFDQLGIYQTRHFLAAKLLGVLMQLGRSGLVDHVVRHTSLARYMMERVREAADLELLAETDLTVVCFRFCPPSLQGNERQLNELNRLIVRLLMRGEEQAFVSGTDLPDGQYAIRSCALHYNLREEHIETIIAVVRRIGMLCLAEERLALAR
jgi:glutamate/tyrosine decarboxylase-like PLP-dependent enzyme